MRPTGRESGAPNLNFKPLEAQLELGKKNFKWIGLMVGTGQGETGSTAASKGAVDYLHLFPSTFRTSLARRPRRADDCARRNAAFDLCPTG